MAKIWLGIEANVLSVSQASPSSAAFRNYSGPLPSYVHFVFSHAMREMLIFSSSLLPPAAWEDPTGSADGRPAASADQIGSADGARKMLRFPNVLLAQLHQRM